jgi:hypothetical protein
MCLNVQEQSLDTELHEMARSAVLDKRKFHRFLLFPQTFLAYTRN